MALRPTGAEHQNTLPTTNLPSQWSLGKNVHNTAFNVDHVLEMGSHPNYYEICTNNNERMSGQTVILLYESESKKGVQQGCNLLPCLFNILEEQVMQKALLGFAEESGLAERPLTSSGMWMRCHHFSGYIMKRIAKDCEPS